MDRIHTAPAAAEQRNTRKRAGDTDTASIATTTGSSINTESAEAAAVEALQVSRRIIKRLIEKNERVQIPLGSTCEPPTHAFLYLNSRDSGIISEKRFPLSRLVVLKDHFLDNYIIRQNELIREANYVLAGVCYIQRAGAADYDAKLVGHPPISATSPLFATEENHYDKLLAEKFNMSMLEQITDGRIFLTDNPGYSLIFVLPHTDSLSGLCVLNQRLLLQAFDGWGLSDRVYLALAKIDLQLKDDNWKMARFSEIWPLLEDLHTKKSITLQSDASCIAVSMFVTELRRKNYAANNAHHTRSKRVSGMPRAKRTRR